VSAACAPRQATAVPSSGPSEGLRVGVVADSSGWGTKAAERQDQAEELGVKWLRENFVWSDIEASDDQFDWSTPDAVVSAASRRGLSVLPTFIDTPKWAGATWNTIPDDPSDFADFVAHVTARYGPGGTFWAAHPELPNRPLSYYEIWNEPYYSWATQEINPGRYARLVKAAAQAGRRANPASKFILAADTDVQLPSGKWVKWTDAMYEAVPDLNQYFDAVAVHPYSKNMAPDAPIDGYIHDKFQRAAVIHDRFAAHGAADKKLWLTEIGWTTCHSGERCVSEDAQAHNMSTMFRMLKTTYADFVGAVFVYHFTDLGSDPDNMEFHYGLRRLDGSHKPAWDVVRANAASSI